MELGLLALALTYLVHSAIWAGAVALLVRTTRLAAAAQHSLWKAALLGPILSASLAAAAPSGFEPLLAELSPARTFVLPLSTGDLRSLLESGSDARADRHVAVATTVAKGAALVVSGALALGLCRFVGAALLLASALRGRKRVLDTEVLARFEAVRARTRVRRVVLTESACARSPLVIGTAEVCVPRQLLGELTPTEVASVFAHELAHIERRDGLWFPLVGVAQSVLWFHPLNHWLASRVRQSAELACDDRAVELTRDALSLARALVHAASLAASGQRALLTPGMANSAGTLVARVKRLTRIDACQNAHGGRDQPLAFAALTALGASLALVNLSIEHPGQWTADAARVASVRSFSTPATPSTPGAGAPEYAEEMARLADRESQLVLELERNQSNHSARQTESTASVRILELSQELRHVRAEQAWREQRFIDQSSLTKP